MSDLVIRSKADVIKFVNEHPVSRSGWLIVLIALGGTFVDGYDFASLGIGVPGLAAEFHLSPVAIGSVAGILGLGAVLGGIVGGYYTDTIGRYKMFTIDLICLVVAAIGAALAPNIYWLLFFRFLMGVGIGVDYPVAFSFMVECVSTRRKSESVTFWVVVYQMALACSVLVALSFYYLGAGDHLWRYTVGFGAIPALAVLALRGRYMSESPMWAAHHLGLREAAKILEKTYNIQVTVIETAGKKPRPPRASFRLIFSPRYLSRTILCSVIAMTSTAQYFAVGFYIPSISRQIFGEQFLYGAIGTLVSTIVGVSAGLGSTLLVNRLGVLRISAIGYLIIIVALVTFWWTAGHTSPYISILIIYLFIVGQAGGPGPQYATISALSYPTNIRGTGSGWSQGMARLGTIIGAYFFPVLLAEVGFNRMMLYLAILPVLALLTMAFIRWEPIGQDVETEDPEDLMTDAIAGPAKA